MGAPENTGYPAAALATQAEAIHDVVGSPQTLFEMRYPASGAPPGAYSARQVQLDAA
ncbi:MAG: hypothetical protein M3Y65_06515 [Pseudomonadota bacterium]|nr:hypothetical protein [Pseudomonadota bacterium]